MLAAGTLAAMLGACSADYDALRGWSLQAREAVLPQDAPRAASSPGSVVARPQGSRADAVFALQQSTADWLAALAALADDVTPPADGAAMGARADRVSPFDPEGAAAVAWLGQTLDYIAGQAWRAPQIAYAVDKADAPFQATMAALARQVVALAADQAPFQGAPPDARSDAAFAARRAAIARIAEGHALLKQRENILAQSDTARTLRAEASELRRLMTLATPPVASAGLARTE